jgi:Fur family ferric uptake transcriptional regulator
MQILRHRTSSQPQQAQQRKGAFHGRALNSEKGSFSSEGADYIMPLPASLSPRMTPPHDLKSSGLKITAPRVKILDLFQKSQARHLSAEDVYKLLLAEDMDVGLATVYRVLTQFEQAGLLQRHHFESGKAVFEINEGSHHDHLVCVQCGLVEEFFDEEIERRQNLVAEARGFKVREHALYLYAECLKDPCPHRKT